MSDADVEYQRLLEFLYLVPVGLIRTDRAGNILNLNPMATSTLAVLAGGRPPTNAFDALETVLAGLRSRVAHGAAGHRPIDHVDFVVPGAEEQIVSLTVEVLEDEELAFLLTDVTERVRQRRQIIRRERQLSSILETVHNHMIALLDSSLRIQEYNPSLARLGGFDESVVGESVEKVFRSPAPELADHAKDAERSGWSEFEAEMVCLGKEFWWGDSVLSRIPDPEGNTVGFALVTREATERRRRERDLQSKVYRDSLTQLLNRHAFEGNLDRELARSARYGHGLALLIIDIDHFKQINDRYGHPAGDEVLKAVAARLQEATREVDIVVRLGGEEFAVIAPETDSDAAGVLAERCRAIIDRSPFAVEGATSLSVTVSVGVACVNAGRQTAADMYADADGALYDAKAAGRNRIAYATS